MRNAIHPTWPISDIRDAEHLMAIAIGMENAAAARYRHLAAEMDRRQEDELAALFHRLGELESRHEAGLRRWAERDGLAPPLPLQHAWPYPETFGSEADGSAAHVLTPYRALAIAVRNEENAFVFYSYLSAMAPDAEVRRRADALAREELSHIAELRALRRTSFHAGRQRQLAPPRTVAEVEAAAAALEAGAARLCGLAAEVSDGPIATLLRSLAEEAAARAGDAAAGSTVLEAAQASGVLNAASLTRFGILRLTLRHCEEALAVYLAAADHAADPALLDLAQDLARTALARLAVIRKRLAEEPAT